MKAYEYIGVMITMAAYYLIMTGDFETGIYLGMLGNIVLGIFLMSRKLFGLLGLQFYFFIANIIGLGKLVAG